LSLIETEKETTRIVDPAADFADIALFYRKNAIAVANFVAKQISASPDRNSLSSIQLSNFQ